MYPEGSKLILNEDEVRRHVDTCEGTYSPIYYIITLLTKYF